MVNSRPSVACWFWTHNPFYVISSLLMLYGVRAGYGDINIGTINCWIMMGILATYTVVLATVGAMIVRWGNVWDDARSIFLLLLLMFLAVSVSADDLFVNMKSAQGGAILMGAGLSFSVAVLLSVLRVARIHLHRVYLVPLILFLALFFVAPWWCSPELHPTKTTTLNATLFLFPQIAAVLTLLLIPAVRMQQRSIEGNGTPWPWPLFPWSAFAMLGIAVVLRSYALTLTYSPSGPMWKSELDRSGIILDTIWRPYFLVPFALAILVLIIEAGLATGNQRLIRRGLLATSGIMLLAWPWNPGETMSEFLFDFTWTLGSPVWLSVWLLIGFFGWAVVRRVRNAEVGLLVSFLALSIVGPKTISVDTLTTLSPIPPVIVGVMFGVLGIKRRSSALSLTAAGLVTSALWVFLEGTSADWLRGPICYHILFASCVLTSIFWQDPISKRLQSVGAILLMASSLLTLHSPSVAYVPWEWRVAYVFGLIGIGYACARVSRGRAYWTGLIGTIGVLSYAIALAGYRHASWALGRQSVVAFSWSLGTLLIGMLISAYKARWLPPVWGHRIEIPGHETIHAEVLQPDEGK